jgi:hypothetical protein
MKYYAGIGSRTIPPEIYRSMTILASTLESRGYTLRSGNATGSDQAFASGVETNAQIWLPWLGFENEFKLAHPAHEYRLVGHDECPGEPDDEAWDSVEKFHPIFEKDSDQGDKFSRFSKFMSRNYRQIRGLGQPDSEFVICWTHDGTDVGGTGQAIRIANHYKIPVFNMYELSMSEVLKEIDKYNLLH